MANLIPKNEATLRAILKLGEADLHDVEAVVGNVAKEAINSLYRCEFLQVVKTRRQRTKSERMREMHVYAITDKGRQKLQDIDYPTDMEMRSVKASKPAQNLHRMEHLIIPTRDPNVKEMMTEIGGRQVKITYGSHHPYELLKPDPDHARNYRNYIPRPIRGILG